MNWSVFLWEGFFFCSLGQYRFKVLPLASPFTFLTASQMETQQMKLNILKLEKWWQDLQINWQQLAYLTDAPLRPLLRTGVWQRLSTFNTSNLGHVKWVLKKNEIAWVKKIYYWLPRWNVSFRSWQWIKTPVTNNTADSVQVVLVPLSQPPSDQGGIFVFNKNRVILSLTLVWPSFWIHLFPGQIQGDPCFSRLQKLLNIKFRTVQCQNWKDGWEPSSSRKNVVGD